MSRFIKSNWARAISRLLIATMLMPFFSLAYSQITIGGSGGNVPRWAVLDFTNKSGVGGTALAKQTSDSIALELGKSAKYNISLKSEVDAAMQEAGLTAPLNKLGYLQLGETLGVEAVVIGAVEQVTWSKNPRVAHVIISVRVVDVASGLEVNGAYGSGQSSARPGFTGDDDTLIQEALSLASYDAIQQIRAYTLPAATVLSTLSGKNILLNRGSRDGIKVGMRMVVLRGREQVGEIRITSVTPTDATGAVISEKKGIAPQDKAREVFELGALKVNNDGKVDTAKRTKSQTGISKLGSGIMPLLIVLALVAVVGKGGGGGNTAAEDVTAQATSENGNPAVLISWKPTLFAKNDTQNIMWAIYRSDQDLILDGNGNQIPVGVAVAPTSSFIDRTDVRSLAGYPSPPRGGSEDDSLEGVDDVPGITPGINYTYGVRLYYLQQPLDTASGETARYMLSDRVSSGQVTPLSAPVITNPVIEGSAYNGQFAWMGVAGANEYFIEVSSDQSFGAGSQIWTRGPIYYQGISEVIESLTVNFNTIFSSVTPIDNERTLYLRIGARRSSDRPGPVADAHGYRYVWSNALFGQARMFKVPAGPPPPP